MASFEISIPKPVLTVEVDYDPDGFGRLKGGEHVATIQAGGVVLHKERFTSEYDWSLPSAGSRRPANYVLDADAAADEAIANFGKRLLALFEGETK